MPGKEEFQHIHSIPLFLWLIKNQLSVTWWLWCCIGILSVITMNTLFCSVESLIKKRKVTQWLLLISPQIIHVGFLFMLLAHLLSALSSSQGFAAVPEGSFLNLTGSSAMLRVKEINFNMDPSGYISDWEVNVEYYSGEKIFKKDTLRPNNPSIYRGVNISVKDLSIYPGKAVLLQVSKDPGALWALIGGIFFMGGIAILIILKIRLEK